MLKQKKVVGMMGAMLLAFSSLSAKNVKPNGCEGPVLCPSFPVADKCAECCYTWHVDIGFIYQQPGFANMTAGLAYTGLFQDPATEGGAWVDQTIGTLDSFYDYSPGVTASLGYLLKHDNWYVGADFDYLPASLNASYSNPNILYIPSSEFNFTAMNGGEQNYPYGYWQKVVYSANADIYRLNLRLSRGSYHTNAFSYEPFAGVKALWFENSQTKRYEEPNNPAANSTYVLTMNQQNWGVGPMFGFNGEYHITAGISIFSDSNIGVLCGKTTYSMNTAVSAGADISTDRSVLNSGVLKNTVYLPARTILGIKLAKYFLEDSHYVALKIGYDAQAVVSPSDTVVFTQGWEAQSDKSPISSSTLTSINNGYFLSGLYLDLSWDF